MRPTFLIPAAAIVLGGCGQEAAEPRTAEQVVAEAGKLEKPRAGQYETKVEVAEFSVPGLPAQQAEQMKNMVAGAQGKASQYCLTEAEAQKGFEDSVRKMSEGNGQMQCDFDRFAVDGGKLDAALTCRGPQGMTANIAVDGRASSEASTMHMTMEQKSAMLPGGGIRMEMNMNSRRIGDCPA